MVKKQVGFQVASYEFADWQVEERQRMRAEVQAVQESGWEVQSVIWGGKRLDVSGKEVDLLIIPMVKYVWVEEPLPVAKVGRPKKTE